ncbi:MAG: glutamine--tRNA ligase, partial [Deltaproteobacteria bacterium]|nr:glutamine--tRNA ligase [Deltaproteobacteria bacterium]
LYDHLFIKENPSEAKDGPDFKAYLNPNSFERLISCLVDPSLADAAPENCYQFLRQGYFCVDSKDSVSHAPVFNRTVTLRDTWAKIQKSRKK